MSGIKSHNVRIIHHLHGNAHSVVDRIITVGVNANNQTIYVRNGGHFGNHVDEHCKLRLVYWD